jgi:hypothetical protein
MPSEGFEPMIPALERAKTVHALDSAAPVTDDPQNIEWKFVRIGGGPRFIIVIQMNVTEFEIMKWRLD